MDVLDTNCLAYIIKKSMYFFLTIYIVLAMSPAFFHVFYSSSKKPHDTGTIIICIS